MVDLMLDATKAFDRELTVDRLFDWNAALVPTGRSVMTRIPITRWRDDNEGPMDVVSGPVSWATAHFSAPLVEWIPGEVNTFLA